MDTLQRMDDRSDPPRREPSVGNERQNATHPILLGTGAAFGHHYTTDEMIDAFRAQRIDEGDVECDLEFAERVFRACGYDAHSVTLAREDLFRRMTRVEYLQRRMTNLLDLAASAADDALRMWGGDRSSITHLYWGTMTGGMDSPTIDILLTERLGLSPDVERTSIEGMGCLTGFRLLNLARTACLAEPNARVLAVAGDLRSALQNSLPERVSKADIVSAALFRDAASAAVVGGQCWEHETAHFEIVAGKSRIVAGTRELVSYCEQDGGSIQLHLSKRLPDAVAAAEPDFVRALFAEAERRGEEAPQVVDLDIACHTGGPRILHEVAAALEAEDEQLEASWAVMKAHGNLSGASNLAVLHHHIVHVNTGRDWVLCLSMGPGVCLEGLLLRRAASRQSQDADEAAIARLSGVRSRSASAFSLSGGRSRSVSAESAAKLRIEEEQVNSPTCARRMWAR